MNKYGFFLFFGAEDDFNEDKGVYVKRRDNESEVNFEVVNNGRKASVFLSEKEALELASNLFRNILDLY